MKFDPRKKLEKCITNIIKQFEVIDKIVCKMLDQDKPSKNKVIKKHSRKARKSKNSA